MALDPQSPVIVGVGQLVRRPSESQLVDTAEPAEMLAEALRRAEVDSGATRSLLAAADSVRTVSLVSWRYRNAPLAVAEAVGATPKETVSTAIGGNSPQMLVNDTALAIQRGDVRVALVGGAEAVYTRLRVRKAGVRLDWSTQDESVAEPRLLGEEKAGTNDAEIARTLMAPIQVYPVFENAVRAAAGETVAEHQERVSTLWARFSEVAATNPYAWFPTARSAEEIRTVTADNRIIGWPYPKLMNSVIDTDQAAGLIMCSVEAARDFGVPEDRWVFPWSGADSHDHWWISERADLCSSPAIRLNGEAAMALADVNADDIAHLDLYSCFPSAVQIGAAALGFALDDPTRALTVTGGLGFAGGPANNYVTHSIAAMCEVLRQDAGSMGLVTALGWYCTKHSLGIYSTTPPPTGFRHADPQGLVDATPSRRHVADHEGQVTIESLTVTHDRDGTPLLGIVACLLPDGSRAWGNTNDLDTMQALMADDAIGRAAMLHTGGAIDLL